MPRTGRPRKPTRLKVLEGNPGKRSLDRNEPQHDPTVPKPPNLSETASAWWDFVVPRLVKVGLASSVDQAALHILAEDYAAWREASEAYQTMPPLLPRGYQTVPVLKKDGTPYADGRTRRQPILVTNPLWRIVRDAGQAYRQGAASFGLDARSRAGLAQPDQDFDDLDADFEKWHQAIEAQKARQASGDTT